MSSGYSTSANATALIQRRWRGADRCSKNEMSEPENFIARWSRRKREAAEEARSGDEARRRHPAERMTSRMPAVTRERPTPRSAAAQRRGRAADSEFDWSKLPPVETITAESDIRAFLGAGRAA